jgi:hypothetical protein
MFNKPSEREIKKLRPTVHMGGSVTRNGVNVDKEIEAQTAHKYAKSKALSNKKDVGYSDKNHEQFHPEKSKKEYHNMQVRNIKKATKEWGLK